MSGSPSHFAHETACIDDGAEIGEGTKIWHFCHVMPGARIGRAMWFSHAPISWGDGPLYHHIGLYAYRRPALERYVTLTPSPLELRERLEQLRALEDGMRIDAALVDSVPLGVDTPADLEQIRAMMAGAS